MVEVAKKGPSATLNALKNVRQRRTDILSDPESSSPCGGSNTWIKFGSEEVRSREPSEDFGSHLLIAFVLEDVGNQEPLEVGIQAWERPNNLPALPPLVRRLVHIRVRDSRDSFARRPITYEHGVAKLEKLISEILSDVHSRFWFTFKRSLEFRCDSSGELLRSPTLCTCLLERGFEGRTPVYDSSRTNERFGLRPGERGDLGG